MQICRMMCDFYMMLYLNFITSNENSTSKLVLGHIRNDNATAEYIFAYLSINFSNAQMFFICITNETKSFELIVSWNVKANVVSFLSFYHFTRFFLHETNMYCIDIKYAIFFKKKNNFIVQQVVLIPRNWKKWWKIRY